MNLTHSAYDKRSLHHDYYDRFIYHIIIKKRDGTPDFGAMRGSVDFKPGEKGAPYLFPFETGKSIIDGLKIFEKRFPEIRKFQYMLMPDHLHLIIYKTVKNNIHLDEYITFLKTIISSEYNRKSGTALSNEEIFQEGYTDKALYDKVSLDAWIKYVRENPYRRVMIEQRPEFFKRSRCLKIDNESYEAYGNLFLYDNPDKFAVRVRRVFTAQEVYLHKQQAIVAAQRGSVLISPFISSHEKEIRKEAELMNSKIILIRHEEFGERFKPPKHDFELCSQGKLLIISLGLPKGTELTYAISTRMNELAYRICDITR